MMLSGNAFELPKLLNVVGKGAGWPKQMFIARAAFMSKDEADPLNHLAYRVVLMMSAASRLWYRSSLCHLGPWIETRATEEMYAGVEGRGAADAAYAIALEIEMCALKGIPLTGGATDICKCFGHV